MQPSLFFYDLETSGFNPRDARIMQFAGQRTDLSLNVIGEPVNELIALAEDTLPEPEAIMVTGITPQQTQSEGLSEADFLHLFYDQIAIPGTVFVGFNSVRFDDEFMRFLNYRNFYDPYEWQWKDDRGRWDILDVVRMTRGLRPDGITWPFDSSGKPTNRLADLTELNNLQHDKAHDAMSDVTATIAVAKLIQAKQPRLFEYLFSMRHKTKIADFCESNQLFVYTSGRYSSEWHKTTVVSKIVDHPKKQGILVYDLRCDPTDFLRMTPQELVLAWQRKIGDDKQRLPVKTLQFNRCPAVAPLAVLDQASKERLGLDMTAVQQNFAKIKGSGFEKTLLDALQLMDDQQSTLFEVDTYDVDAQMYDGFFAPEDRTKMSLVRAADVEELKTLEIQFADERLRALFPLYKARNYPQTLNDEERIIWDKFRERRLMGGKQASRAAKYFQKLSELYQRADLSATQRYVIEELRLYGESILPTEE